MANIGLIQVRGLGDCIIILPIAKFFHAQGHTVHIALDERYCEQFKESAPYCNFVPVPYSIFDAEKGIHNEYWFEYPYQMLKELNCDPIISFPQHESILIDKYPELINHLGNRIAGSFERHAFDTKAFKHLKFDEYKYYVAQLPLRLKWTLSLNRNLEREHALYDKLVDPKKKQIVCHLEGSNFSINSNSIKVSSDNYQIIKISPEHTDNIFDWLTILERADTILLIDSVFFNLVEQLNFTNKKYFIRRSPRESTPVIGNQWEFMEIDIPDENHLFYAK